MSYGAMVEALKEVRAEKTEVREALRQRSERLNNEQSTQIRPSLLREALTANLKKD